MDNKGQGYKESIHYLEGSMNYVYLSKKMLVYVYMHIMGLHYMYKHFSYSLEMQHNK